jgi:hypothetical protein
MTKKERVITTYIALRSFWYNKKERVITRHKGVGNYPGFLKKGRN